MKPKFSDAIAETREAFLDLILHTSATFYEVYSEKPNPDLEVIFDELHQGETLLRFDMQKHTGDARSRFCHLSELERRAYDFSGSVEEKPLPYFGAFVPGIGHTGIAWTREEICQLIVRTREEETRMKHVAQLLKTKSSQP